MISIHIFPFIAIVIIAFCGGFVLAAEMWKRIVYKYQQLTQEMLETIKGVGE